ncbi:two-component system, NtrC family, sensor kinase [Myxococcaceae bacterium]|jgi:PAS domain S-box-containing protein|nr:two-component system, NtrC family, sensor kinase [Myxococcaceae bacterium]
MQPALVQALATLSLAATLAFYVGSRRERSAEVKILFALCVALGTWSLGAVLALGSSSRVIEKTGLVLGFAGASVVAPLWLVLAAHEARVEIVVRRAGASCALLLAPSALALALLLTNPLHHLFLRVDTGFGAPPREIVEAGGPVFWAFATWSQLCGLAGALLLLASARRLRSLERRRPAWLLAVAGLVPLLANAAFLSGSGALEVDPTPAAFAISLLLVSAATFRFGLLPGALPLARLDILEHLDDGLLVADADGVVLDSNPAAAGLLECSDLRGRTLDDAIRQVPWDVSREDLEAGLALPDRGEPAVVTVLRHRDDRWIEMRSAAVRGPDGTLIGRYVILHDRTERRRYERFVHQVQKLETVGGMVAGLAHEVNNPLAFVRSNLNTVLRLCSRVERRLDAFDPDERVELGELRTITEETLDGVERIGRIVDGLRRFARPHGEEAVPIDLNAVARQAMRLAELHANRDVLVEARLAPDLPLVKGSADRLGQVVLNLLMNAKHALAQRPFGRIRVETLAQRGGVELHVADNGPGIPEEIQERIFDPFFTTKTPDEGTGLGLSIAFDIVREHGGSLEIVSREGEGARFVVRLPVA